MPRLRTLLLGVLMASLVLAGTAQAKVHVSVAIGDQSAAMFTQPDFKALKIKKARYFMAWDAAKHGSSLRAADAYVAAARKAHVRVLIHISTNNYAHNKAKLPSTKDYKKYVGKLVKRYKAKGVKEWGVWNEANHISEPTWKNPKRAAQYFHIMRGLCHGCKIVALDLLDQAGSSRYSTKSYIAKWFSSLSASDRRAASTFGIHNYADVNRHRSSGTRRILAAVRSHHRSAKFWFTETGGIVRLGKSFKCSPSRAAKAIGYMFTLAKQFRHDVSRLYAYNYFGTNPSCGAFDAGLVNANGKPRTGYKTFKRLAAGFDR